MSDVPVISVSELVGAMKEVIETALPPCCVQGEISNVKKSAAGHYYLTLKDADSEVPAVMWRGAAGRLKFQPKHGMEVQAFGSLQVYTVRGTVQFSISRLQPQGMGELELAFRQLHDRLQKEGLFEAERKRALPSIPRRIALVTSPTSAAVRDMLQVMRRRWPASNVVIVPVRVQGDLAAGEIASALSRVHHIPDVDVVIAGRGGGSLEDLWAFNEEVVARAIAACKIPVVSAVGHEIDLTIADLVADRRALTPSEAAELVVPSVVDVREHLRRSADRMSLALRAWVERHRRELDMIASRPVFLRPESLIETRRQQCDDLAERLGRAMRQRTDTLRHGLAEVSASLNALSPLNVLSRGYSLTQRATTGEIVQAATSLSIGDVIRTRLAEGEVVSQVTEQN